MTGVNVRILLSMFLVLIWNVSIFGDDCVENASDFYETNEFDIQVEGNSIRFCLDKCYSFDTEKGYSVDSTRKSRKESEQNDYRPPLPSATTLEDGIQVCIQTTDCRKITYAGYDPEKIFSVSLSPNTKQLLVVVSKPKVHIEFRDSMTGKISSQLTLKPSPEGYWTDFAGESLYITWAYCAGPCLEGAFYNRKTGKRIAKVGGVDGFYLDGIQPIQIRGDIFAIAHSYGEGLVFQDVKTGKVIKRLDQVKELKKRGLELTTDPSVNVILKLESGQAALLFANPNPGAILMIDAEKMEFGKLYTPKVCEGPK